jgi:hypothetical protein
MEVHCKKWADEKTGWEAMFSQHEDWLEEPGAKWTSLLDAKDYDLLKLKCSYQELNYGATGNVLMSCSKSSMKTGNLLAEHPTLTSFPCRKSQEESEGENCLSIVRFVNEIDMEEESLGMETDKLKTVKIQLEMKARDTPNLIEALQSAILVKGKQMESARKELEAALVLEAVDVEQPKRQLSASAHEMEVLMQKFHNEVLKIDREVESEWNKREEVMEMNFVGKQQLVNNRQEKEQRWQNEIDAITQELSDNQASARQKDEDTTTLRENLHSLKENQKTEDVKVTKLLASFKQEKDAPTNELDHLQKAGKLAMLIGKSVTELVVLGVGYLISLFLNIGKHP